MIPFSTSYLPVVTRSHTMLRLEETKQEQCQAGKIVERASWTWALYLSLWYSEPVICFIKHQRNLLKSISPITGSCLRVPFVMNGKLNRKQRRVLNSPSIELRARTAPMYEIAINVMIPYLQDCYGCRGVMMSGCAPCVSLSEW